MRAFRRAVAVVAVLVGLGLTGGGAWADEVAVRMQGVQYAPAEVRIEAGDTVRFLNDDVVEHEVLAMGVGYAADLGVQKPGEERAFVFALPGTYRVDCVIHANMRTTVRVER